MSVQAIRSGLSTVTFQYPKASLRKDLGLLRILEAHEGIYDLPDVLRGELAILLAQVLPEGS